VRASSSAPASCFARAATSARPARRAGSGVKAEERDLTVEDLESCDEMFSTGNYAKVLPVTRFEKRDFQPGPVYRRARELYFDYAKTQPV